ncbi:MAG: hypothetical protein QM766_25170 [Burkholderiaceae bacterium]
MTSKVDGDGRADWSTAWSIAIESRPASNAGTDGVDFSSAIGNGHEVRTDGPARLDLGGLGADREDFQ